MFLIFSAVSCLLAMVCGLAGVGAVVAQRRKWAGAASAAGQVVELTKRVFRAGSGGVYCPTIQFNTPSGSVIRFESAFGSMPAAYRLGQAVKVHYDPKQPNTAEIESGAMDWLYPGCLLAFAAGAGMFGLLFFGAYLLTSGVQ